MTNEISTAATYRLTVIWIVFNDGRYGMGATARRLAGEDTSRALFQQCDFVTVARGMGADGRRVADISELDEALTAALSADGPFVVDVQIDPSKIGPFTARLRTLDEAAGR